MTDLHKNAAIKENVQKHPLWKKSRLFLTKLRDEKRLSPQTLENYQLELDLFLTLVVDPEDEKDIRSHLREKAPATVVRKIVVWRSFLKECPDPWASVLADLKTPKARRRQPLFLNEDESFRLETICYKTKEIHRNRLLVSLSLEMGLRLSELLHLKWTDVEDEWLRLLRKGGKEQRLPLPATVKVYLQQWSKEQPQSGQGWVFPGHRVGQPMTSRSAQLLVKDLAKKAGILKPISPHSLRHTFASTLAARGASLGALKEILGHERLATTERYIHVTPEHLRETFALLKTPKGTRKENS